LPRRALRSANIRRRRCKNHLPRLPLRRMRHAMERALETVIRVAATGGIPPARLQRAGAPQLERVAIAPLLQRFLRGEALRVVFRRKLSFARRFGQRTFSVLIRPHEGGEEKKCRSRGAFFSRPSSLNAVARMSETTSGISLTVYAPDFAFAHPGYEKRNKRKRNAGRRKVVLARTQAACGTRHEKSAACATLRLRARSPAGVPRRETYRHFVFGSAMVGFAPLNPPCVLRWQTET
jgi:hypothetical protein